MPLPTLSELKNRKVVQWGLAYLAGAWFVLQFLALLGATYNWPGGLLRAVPVLLGVGFVVALVLAWYHGERGVQQVTGSELAILTVLLALAGLGVLLVGDGSAPAPLQPASTAAPATEHPVADQTTLAVLPFATVRADSANFTSDFAAGLTSELLATLARSPALRVAARTSAAAFADTDASSDSIGRALGVAHYVEGTVLRAEDRIRVSVQLIDAQTGMQEWSDTYDQASSDIISVLDEIVPAIASRLQIQIATAGPMGSENPEAYALALEGWRTWERGGDIAVYAPVALGLFQRALGRDSTYAHALAGVATATLYMARAGIVPDSEAAWEVARAAAERAVALDPNEGVAYHVLGRIAEQYDNNSNAAVAYYERAVAANPSDASVLAALAIAYMYRRDKPAAIRTAEQAVILDPLSSTTLSTAAYIYSSVGRHQRATEFAREAIRVSPDDTRALYTLASVLAVAGQTDEAVLVADRLIERYPNVEHNYWVASYVYARAGNATAAERQLAYIKRDHHYFRAAVQAALGQPDSAFSVLGRSLAEGEYLVELAVDPWFANLHADPRWEPFLAEVRERDAREE